MTTLQSIVASLLACFVILVPNGFHVSRSMFLVPCLACFPSTGSMLLYLEFRCSHHHVLEYRYVMHAGYRYPGVWTDTTDTAWTALSFLDLGCLFFVLGGILFHWSSERLDRKVILKNI